MGYSRHDEMLEAFEEAARDRPGPAFDAWLVAELDARGMTPGRLSRLTGLHR
ncbi:MAG: hypothetical protein ACRDGI_08875 [Candidatus Limnocylindrales bacterium]